jgi:Na+/melibiose symporter-like transporter
MLDMRYFRNPSFSVGSGAMMLVFLAMYGVMFMMTQYFQLVLGYSPFSAAVRFLPMAPIMIIVAPSTPWLSARFGANRVVGVGMLLIATGFLLFAQVGLHTGYGLILIALIALTSGMAMSMSPMTAAIMSAVPQRRAGAGSAMNDATRELGAALGVAVLGSIAASQYTSHLHDALEVIPASARDAASSSIAGALHAAEQLGGAAGRAFGLTAQVSFIDGLHVAAYFGVALCVVAAVLTTRYLPRVLVPEGALSSPVSAMESTAELGLGGIPPVLADAREGDLARDGVSAMHDGTETLRDSA